MARVHRTAQSDQDEHDIALYIARDNREAAKRLLTGIGQSRDDLMPGLRSYPVKKTYLLMYRQVGDGIELLRVLHGMRDIQSEFR